MFQFAVDQMQLRNIFELVNLIVQDEELGFMNQMELLNYIIRNKKFVSMFNGSLEMQKYNFVQSLGELLEDEEVFPSHYMTTPNR